MKTKVILPELVLKKGTYQWFEVQPGVVEVIVTDGKNGELIPEEQIPELLNHKDGQIDRLQQEVWTLKNAQKKLDDIKTQMLELRGLVKIAKQINENKHLSVNDKADFFQSFPNDLSAFADSLDDILADFNSQVAYNPTPEKDWDEEDIELLGVTKNA